MKLNLDLRDLSLLMLYFDNDPEYFDTVVGILYIRYRKQFESLLKACLLYSGCIDERSRYFLTMAPHIDVNVLTQKETIEAIEDFNNRNSYLDIEGEFYLLIYYTLRIYCLVKECNPTFIKDDNDYIQRSLIFKIKDLLKSDYIKHRHLSEQALFNEDKHIPEEQPESINVYQLLVEDGPYVNISGLKPLYRQILVNLAMDMRVTETLIESGFSGYDIANVHNRYISAIKYIKQGV